MRFETVICPREGMERHLEATITPQREADTAVRSLVYVGTDITARKRAETDIHALIDAIPQLVWIARPDGVVTYHNQRMIEYLALTHEQAAGDGWLARVHPADRPWVWRAWQSAIGTGEPYDVELRLQDGTSGVYRWFLVRGMPQSNTQGTILHWVGTCTDIEEQKRAEQRLKESEQHWRVLAETVPQLVWTAHPNGQFAYANQRCLDYSGFTLEQIQSNRWVHHQFMHPDDQESNRAHWLHALETGDMYEHEERLRMSQSGEYRWFLVRALPLRAEDGQILKWVGTCTDIEEQKRIEQALRQSQERASLLMNSSIVGIFVDEGEQIIDANETFLRMTGYSRQDLCAGRLNWARLTPPEYRARSQQAHQQLLAQQWVAPFEKEYLCQDGSRLPVLVGGVLLQQHPRQGIGFVLDNSARKELEQRKDTFISIASHELRTPLTSLKLQTALLQRQLARQGILDQTPALSRMEIQTNTLTRLVQELLDVSKIQAGGLEYVRERVDLDVLLREITDTMQQAHPSHTLLVRGTVQTSLMGDRDRLGQVFSNLLSNAIKYSPNAQTVDIDVGASEEVVTIRVHDHGLGIPRELRDKIFERFYRAADAKQRAIPGLGMGLYLVAEIVKGHGGTITVESEVGTGSTFTVTLPKGGKPDRGKDAASLPSGWAGEVDVNTDSLTDTFFRG